MIQLCLEGIIHSIDLLGKYKLDMQRDTFVTSLINESGLFKNKEITIKGVLAIKAIL